MHRVGRYPGKQFVQSCRRPVIDELRENVGKPVRLIGVGRRDSILALLCEEQDDDGDANGAGAAVLRFLPR